jgi:hypothetical protein
MGINNQMGRIESHFEELLGSSLLASVQKWWETHGVSSGV